MIQETENFLKTYYYKSNFKNLGIPVSASMFYGKGTIKTERVLIN